MSEILEGIIERYRKRFHASLWMLGIETILIWCLIAFWSWQKNTDDEFIKQQEKQITKLENDLRYYEDRVNELEDIALELKGMNDD